MTTMHYDTPAAADEISWRARNGLPAREDWTDAQMRRYRYIRWINGR